MNANDKNVVEKDNIFILNTKDCIGDSSLKESSIVEYYKDILEGKIDQNEFKRVLDINCLLDEQRIKNQILHKQPNSQISNNSIFLTLNKKIKFIKSLKLQNLRIPKDILPLSFYIPDFVKNSNNTYQSIYSTCSVIDSPVKNEICENDLKSLLNTPLKFWRTYTGKFSLPNSYTKPSDKIVWNPPQNNTTKNLWPFQPKPKLNQECPTYVARNGVTFSGYGLYDLEDFPVFEYISLKDNNQIRIPLRKLILKLIVPKGQKINGQDAENLIDKSEVYEKIKNPMKQTGYGDYQRFIPGPGISMRYQPNKKRKGKPGPIDLSVSTYKHGVIGAMPVPFPDFKSNTWCNDKFQDKSLLKVLDCFYLNGDLENINGDSVIHPDYDPEIKEYTYEMFKSVKFFKEMTFNTFFYASNPNIKYALNGNFKNEISNYLNYLIENVSEQSINLKIFDDVVPIMVDIKSKTECENLWNKNFHPPLVNTEKIEIQLFTDDKKPINIEKCLGFEKHVKDVTVIQSQNCFKVSDKYSECGFISSCENLNASPKLSNYTNKNISFKFNAVSYETENKQITEIFSNNAKQGNKKNFFKDHAGNVINFIPMASNIEKYSS